MPARRQWTRELSHGDRLSDPDNTQCLHPLCSACTDELNYRERVRTNDLLERIALAVERLAERDRG